MLDPVFLRNMNNIMNTAVFLELAALKPDTDINHIGLICKKYADQGFSNLCVPPMFIKHVRERSLNQEVRISTVAGFPFGYSAVEAKVAEIILAIVDGVDEIEMVMNTLAARNNDWQYLAGEINTIMPIIRGKGKKITVIMEPGFLTDQQKIAACDLYGAAGVDFIKLGTGTDEIVSKLEHTRLIRSQLADLVHLKVWVGNTDHTTVKKFVNAGAHHLCLNWTL